MIKSFKDKYIDDIEDEFDLDVPQIEDFGLTKEDIRKYEEQKSRAEKAYREAKEKQEKKQEEQARYFLSVVIITLVIILIILIVRFYREWMGILVVFSIGCSSIIGITWMLHDKIKFRPINIEQDYFTDPLIANKLAQYNQAIEEYNKKLEKYKDCVDMSRRNYWINMDFNEFEDEIAKVYRWLGYNAKVTPRTGDGGVDIILKKGDERIAVQCKHHQTPVGPHDVRALVGVIASEDYTSGIFVSLNGYTQSVYNENNARNEKVRVKLLSLSDILAMVEQCKPKRKTSTLPQQPSIKSSTIINNGNVFYSTPTTKRVQVNSPVSTNHTAVTRIRVGSIVRLYNKNDDEMEVYRIVAENNKAQDGVLSINTEFGRKLLGKGKGERITLETPNGEILEFKIMEIK